MADVLEDLRRVVDRLGEADPFALSDDELHAVVVGLQRERARLGAVAAALLSSWDARRIWSGDGSRSAAGRLSRETGCSAVSAGVEMRRARQQRTLLATTAAIARGELSLDHLDVLGRANQPHRAASFARDEAFLVEQCTRLRYAPAVRMIGYWCQRADAELGHDDGAEPVTHGHLHMATTWEGAVVANGVLDAVGGAVVIGELSRLEADMFSAGDRDGVILTAAQRRAAALVEMARRSATAPAAGRRARPLFTVLVGDQAFTELCELTNGTVITPRQLTPWLDSAVLETVLFDGPSTVVSVSHRRAFTGAVRRAVEVRDRHCQHPAGCDVPVDRCDVDHIVPHARGGETSQFNGRLECTAHNRHADLHDHDAIPRPTRPITRLDELRARIRWRILHDHPEDHEPPLDSRVC
jgi:hypothetical protein